MSLSFPIFDSRDVESVAVQMMGSIVEMQRRWWLIQYFVSNAATDLETGLACDVFALIVSEHLRQIMMMSGRFSGELCPS